MRYIISTLVIVFVGLCFGFSNKRAHIIMSNNKIEQADAVVLGAMKEAAADQKVETTATPVFSEVAGTDYVAFAKTLIGTPYLYGSVDPARGFDCSGFINYISKHFDMKVPRSSVDFTNFGTTIDSNNAQPGDLILFTGTDATRRIVGHMGIITGNVDGKIQFIHSSSGKGKGVVISDLEGYYETRFVKVIRILSEGENS
jgi:cell wall-associated NlpC family hydrolase